MEIKEAKGKKKITYKDLFCERNFMLDTLASIISRFGDGIDTIAFSLLVYHITGSTLLVATLYGINGIPNLVFGMISGVACKYITDKKIMAICDFGRFACVFLVASLFLTGNLAVWHLYVITFLNSSFESFRGPASISIVPKIIPMEKMEYGMALSSSGCKLSELIGLAIAPLIFGTMGLGWAVVIDAVTFFICGLLILGLRIKDSTVSAKNITIRDTFNDLKEGFLFVKSDKLILNIVIFAAVLNALVVPLNSLQAPYAEEVLGVGGTALSIMSIGMLVGMMVTGIFAPKIKEKLKSRKMFISGGIIVGISYAILSLLGMINSIELMYLALAIDAFIFGSAVLFLNFPLQIIMMKKIEQEYLPRVSAIFNAGALCAVPIAACITGIVSQYIDIKNLFMIFGILMSVLFLFRISSKITKRYDEY